MVDTASPAHGNLPMFSAGLVGRDDTLEQVLELVRHHRLVTLTGVGGVGKTRLAIEAALALAGDFPDGRWIVELAAVGDGSSLPDAVAAAIGIAPQGEVPVAQTVADALAGRRILLVLDNCEHLVDASAEMVNTLLGRAPGVSVLATSRECLWVGGEQRFQLPPLSLEGGIDSPAATLFIERARAVQPEFRVDGPSADAIVEICTRLDGLALAIELAASRMASMTPLDVRDRLDDRFRLLSGPARGPERQQTLRGTVEWSYGLLDDTERMVLQHASVFAGGFDPAALTAVVGTMDELRVLEVLDSLVRKSLVVAGDHAGRSRHRLLETIRQFAEDELRAAGTHDDARDRHARHYAAVAVRQWGRWNGPAFHAVSDWVRIELANLRAAFRWATERNDVHTATDLAAHTALLGTPIELFEAIGWCEQTVETAGAAEAARFPRLHAAAGYGCFTGRGEVALGHARRACELEVDPRYDPFEPGLATFIQALAQVYTGHLDQYVELARQVATLPGTARAYGIPLLVDGLQAIDHVDEAIDLADEGVAAARELGNPFWIAYALWVYGAAFSKADPAAALTAWREALQFVQHEPVHFFVGFVARDAARLQTVDADPDDTLAMLDAAVDSFHQSGNVAQLTITLATATSLFHRIGHPEIAATMLASITRQPAALHHAPDLADLEETLRGALGQERFDTCAAAGAPMDLNDLARHTLSTIRDTRAQLVERTHEQPRRPAGLSKREVEVLRLVAEGLSAREIGERLFISARTAEHHIQHVYTKTGVNGRVAVARWAAEHLR